MNAATLWLASDRVGGHVRPRASTCDTHAPQKRWCPQGTRATLASRGTRRQTSRCLPPVPSPTVNCGCCLFMRFWTRLSAVSGSQPLKLTSACSSTAISSIAFSAPVCGGAVPPSQKIFWLLGGKIARFGAFWVLFLQTAAIYNCTDCCVLHFGVFPSPLGKKSGRPEFFWLLSGKLHIFVHSGGCFLM